MSSYKLRPREATRQDVEYIAANMRDADRSEFEAASGLDAFKALESDYATSAVTLCADSPDGKPFVIFGYKQKAPGKAQCWMCTTREIENSAVRREFWRISKQFCEELCERLNMVYGFVDTRHTASIRWLRRLGFKFSEPLKIGKSGEFFYKFEKGGRKRWAL